MEPQKTKAQKEIKDNPINQDVAKGIYKFITPEEIDNAIKGHLARVKEIKNNSALPWDADLLLLRNSVIIEYICHQGLSNYNTARQICDRWGIAWTTAKRWITEALHSLTEHATENIEDAKRKHIERIEHILQDALECGNNDTALKAIDHLAKVMGFNSESKNVKLTGGDEPIKFDFGE